jgi:hypothetical protein
VILMTMTPVVKTTRELVLVALLAGAVTASAQQPTPPAAVPYDVYCAKSMAEKGQIFKAASPEQKVTLWRTQVERWRDANNARLNADQRGLLQEMLAILVPSTFTPAGHTPEMRAKQDSLDARIKAAFSSEDRNAFDEDGPCIAKTVK